MHNERGFLAIQNLLDAVDRLLEVDVPGRFNSYLISDGPNLSVAEFVSMVATAMGRGGRLVKVPVPLLAALAAAGGKSEELRRMVAPLPMDTRRITQDTGWAASYSTSDALIESFRS
jgi:UDP-glucose 4-epimerase